ncbi:MULTISPECIES: ABC transporter substrate-binding protein [Pseudomonas]|jgi:arginine/ornithine transport system substrate-binding protein|uniref:Lysine/arginine/ornithine-binding periplasmic protein n=1 Tax=Pseudomonas fluorescens TaxID=294 RepID=A0A5E7S776_PSEFL|nr:MULTISPECIES: ABC transporter substrate-binding protein [Pseudomonas]OPK11716.1 ABC transporter substrate-binding protein [Pseudomonas sp. VI4.1]QCY13026.1 ABC transporter substrate-binding protein [Pseudomonas sp. MPC6]VVP81718.1 Lysine/arginine/ornithine-binding periplasmic protein [Pseudomonas fluorescens]VVQ25199.1 Lysine/arginine/ornithine-binding periplasmic protein [Pseudomonas fluorescens]
MNVKNTLLKVGLISLLAFGAHLHAAEQPLRLGIEAAYPPFASKTPDNTIVGFDYDIGQALCAEMKVQCVWQEQEFDGLIPALKVKKVDAVISSMSMTPERLKSVDFSNRYYRIPARLVFKKGSGISEIPAQLKGKRIGVQRATNFDRYVTEKFAPAGAEVVRYGSQNEIFLDLLGGRLDATMASSVVIDESLLKRPEGQDFEFVGPNFTEEQFFGTGIGIAVRKNDPLAGRFNQALATIRANGTYDTIRQKYFDFDIYGE